jgi:hypothetical protein
VTCVDKLFGEGVRWDTDLTDLNDFIILIVFLNPFLLRFVAGRLGEDCWKSYRLIG